MCMLVELVNKLFHKLVLLKDGINIYDGSFTFLPTFLKILQN